MITPPPNPKQAEARAAIMAHTALLLTAPARDDVDDAALYPLDAPRSAWVTFADATGCGRWDDDPASVGV